MSIYKDDDELGKKGLEIFCKKFFRAGTKIDVVPLEIKEQYDVMVNSVKYECKTNYKDKLELIIEEFYNTDEKIKGWMYTSKPDYIVFVGRKNIVIYPFPALKKFWDLYKDKYEEIFNSSKTTGNYGKLRQSSFRKIPMADIPIKPIIW